MRSVLLCLCAALLISACGKKGNPLPPLVRVPAAPNDFAVTRVDDQVYVKLTVPSANIDGERPADVGRVEVYAITLDGAPPAMNELDAEDLREASTLVASELVRRPLPPLPPVKEGMPPIPLAPQPGVEQGASIAFREQLTPELSVTAVLPKAPVDEDSDEVTDVPGALVAPPPGSGLQRYYYAVAVSPRGRYGPHTAVVPAPLGTTSGPPSEPRITVTETSMALQWTPPVDARGLGLADDPAWLTARPTVPGPPPTTYDVYEGSRNASSEPVVAAPAPLNAEPIAATEYSQDNITLGTERCFYVRAVDIIDGVHVRGPASPTACASFADTFPPAPARELVAVAVPGGINLIWEPSDAADVAGYIVLRGDAGNATLTPLMTEPVTTPSYRDEKVTAGTRYVYVVIAVDRAGNRSAESNRVEETAQ